MPSDAEWDAIVESPTRYIEAAEATWKEQASNVNPSEASIVSEVGTGIVGRFRQEERSVAL